MRGFTVGVKGVGRQGSLGFDIVHLLVASGLVDSLLLNQRDNDDGKDKIKAVKDTIPSLEWRNKIRFAYTDELAEYCDLVVFCYDNLVGQSRGNYGPALPKDIKERIFNANIKNIMQDGKRFGELRSKALKIVCSNPVDLLAYYMERAFMEALGGGSDDPDFRSLTAGLNEIDRMRILRRIEDVFAKSGINPQLHVDTYGTHDMSYTAFIDQFFLLRNDKAVRLLEEKGFGRQMLEKLVREAVNEPPFMFKQLGNTSVETAHALMRVFNSYAQSKGHAVAAHDPDRPGICSLSTAITDVPETGYILPFVGRGSNFIDGKPEPVIKRALLENADQRTTYDSTAIRETKKILTLDDRMEEIEDLHARESIPSVSAGKYPKFQRELVVPVNYGRTSTLLFLNLTEPYDDFTRVREKITLEGQVVYTKNVEKDNKNLLALIMGENLTRGNEYAGVIFMDPLDPANRTELRAEGATRHFNSVCIHDGKVYTTINKGKKTTPHKDAGLYVEEGGKLTRLTLRDRHSENMCGSAISLGDKLLYITDREVVQHDPRTHSEQVIYTLNNDEKTIKIEKVTMPGAPGTERILLATDGGAYLLNNGGADRIFEIEESIRNAPVRADGLKAYPGKIQTFRTETVNGELTMIFSTGTQLHRMVLDNGNKQLHTVESDNENPALITYFLPDDLGGIAIGKFYAAKNRLYWNQRNKDGTIREEEIPLTEFKTTKLFCGELCEYQPKRTY